MKAYTQLLDILILSLLALSIGFLLTNNSITDSFTGRRGVIRTMIISWQTLLFVASFCVFLRYVARNIR
jgi:hypothetical protein